MRESGTSASATVTVIEPNVTITKTVRRHHARTRRQPFTYTLDADQLERAQHQHGVRRAWSVTSSRPASSSTRPRSPSGGTLTGADPVNGGGTITWPDITAGSGAASRARTSELTYAAQLAPSTTLTGAALTNTAAVPSYASLPSGGPQLHRTEYDGHGHAGLPPADDDQDGGRPGAGLHRLARSPGGSR